jgi:hypothetical protein
MENQNYACCSSWKNPKTIIMLVGIVLLAGIVTVSILRDRIVNQNLWTINVVGQGKITYQPDTAKISLGVQIDKVVKAEDALGQLNDKIDKVFKALESAGVSKDDIQTQNYVLNPQYDMVDNISKLTGYSANQTIVVKVKGVDGNSGLVSNIISVASKAGANQVGGVTFEPEDLNNLKQQARLKAIEDARSKANDISKALGVRLDKVVGWWENLVASPETVSYNFYGGMGIGGGGGTAQAPLPAGNREIVIEVNLNYRIK